MKLFSNIPLRAWVIFICCLIIIFISGSRLFDDQELIFYDLRFKLRPEIRTHEDIVLIEIDDDTLQKLGHWPLPRDFHASLVDVLNELGAKRIVFDLLFSEPTDYDDILSESLKKSGNVYLPLVFDIPEHALSEQLPFTGTTVLTDITPVLKSSAFAVGHINVFVDQDGKTRRIPLFMRGGGTLTLQMAFKAACDQLGLNTDRINFKGNRIFVDGKLALPVSRVNEFIVNYPGKWATTFRHMSYLGILKSYQEMKEGKQTSLDLSSLHGKVCFIGLTATGTTDLRPTPLENIYPMLGLQASVFNSIIERGFITNIGILGNTLINLCVFVLGLITCLHLSPLRSLGCSVALGFFYFVVVSVMFCFYGIWVDLFLPLSVIFSVYVGSTLVKYLNEIKKRQLMEKELEIAQKIQESFLPRQFRGVAGLSLALFFQPAKFVAGDLYDIFKLDEKKIGVLIGDVSGKGVSASLLMAQAISLFRILVRQWEGTSEILRQLNKELYGKVAERFVTALYLVADVEHKKIFVSSAGQGPLFHYRRKENRVVDVDLSGNVPLGLLEDVEYKTVEFDVEYNDKIVLFSDGVSEARNQQGDEFGLENIKRVIAHNADNSSEKTLAALKEALYKFSNRAPQHDDITLMTFTFER